MLSACRRSIIPIPKHISVLNKQLDIYSKLSVIPLLQIRCISSRDILFGGKQNISLSDIPPMPEPLAIRPTIEELVASGHSVLEELGLFSWWKPSGWLRLLYENVHLYTDLPWWGTIVCGNFFKLL